MRSQHNIDALISTNPQVDASQLKEVLRLLSMLRKLGVKDQEYSIESPFTRHVGTNTTGMTPEGRKH